MEAEKDSALPIEFYEAQVDSMFADAKSLAIGTLASSAVALYVAYQIQSVDIGCIAAALPGLGGLRLYSMWSYSRRPRAGAVENDLRKWELFYILGASAHVLLLGALCLFTFLETGDGFARLASFVTVMAYLVGIPGRNFASNRLVNVLIACAAAPLFIALLLAGRDYWLIAVLVLVPFFSAMRSISIRLRGVFLDAVLRAHDISRLASQFDTALNNMPCGLAMLDRKGRVVVTNQRLGELLGLQSEGGARAIDLAALLRRCVNAGVLDEDRANDVLERLNARMNGGAFEELLLELNSGRILDLTLQPMENGGAVVLFDDVTERNLAQARINELARFDPLTGLPNRTEFRDRAGVALGAIKEDVEAAMMFVDLDQFKQVNDTLGHAIGDLLLSAAADRLRRSVRSEDLVARLGGDEFVILLTSADSLAAIEKVARDILEDLSNPFEIAGNSLRLGGSIGIARTCEVGRDLGALLRCADMALYQAKADGRGTYRLFEPGMEVKARVRRELEFDLRLALENDQLELHFQPIFNVAKRKFLGCEALLRWRHETRGPVPPSVFVPIAEEIGLIGKLDEWVLRKACRAATAWPRDIKVAVNLSAVHFQSSQIIETVKNALAASQLPPERLELEITETALLHNLQLTRSILYELRRLGVRISLDDFGTGYSSLSYLHSLPLNKIKIDRSFLFGLDQDSQALKLLSGVTRLSKDLGLTIVMEGVETHEQLATITRNTSVDEIQGFLFSAALSQSEITNLFEKKQRSAA